MAGKLALALLLAAAPARAVLTSNAEVYLDRGLKHLYGLDYPQARADFRKLIELEPDNPFGYLFESGAIWWQSSQEYGLFKDTPTLQGLFEQDVEAAIRKADPLTDSRDKKTRAEGHFISGMALGTRGQWGLMRGHYLKAFFDGKKAMKHLKKCAKIDDEYYDVNLGLGVFDYQAANLQGVAKFSAIVGVRGDEARGLQRIRLAMEKGRYASRQAAQFLSSIYLIDKRDWRSSIPVLEKLRSDFPDSVYFQSLDAMARWKLGEKEASLREGRAIFERVKDDPKSFNRKLLSLVCGLYGDHCLDAAHASELRLWLDAAIDATPEPKPAKAPAKAKPAASTDLSYLTLLRLYRGYAFDVLGQTDQAAADFDWVLKHPNVSDSHARARECEENGCAAKDVLLYLRALSRDEPWPPLPSP